MSLKFYNTYTHTTEEFIPGGVRKNSPADYDAVSIYSCGPTVYSYAHIGNFRTFTLNDLLRRYLKYSGYKVEHTMNITDVDDKTIKGANENGLSLKDFTEKYTNIFFEDLASLSIEQFEHYPRATDNIDSMDDIIERLRDKGLVYEKDGSLYFSIAKFEQYGKLSNLRIQLFLKFSFQARFVTFAGFKFSSGKFPFTAHPVGFFSSGYQYPAVFAVNDPGYDLPFAPGKIT